MEQDKQRSLIKKIADRARLDWGLGHLTIFMDLDTVKTHLDLDQLLYSDNHTFTHDIGGINKHLNRETGELIGFHPICAKQQGE